MDDKKIKLLSIGLIILLSLIIVIILLTKPSIKETTIGEEFNLKENQMIKIFDNTVTITTYITVKLTNINDYRCQKNDICTKDSEIEYELLINKKEITLTTVNTKSYFNNYTITLIKGNEKSATLKVEKTIAKKYNSQNNKKNYEIGKSSSTNKTNNKSENSSTNNNFNLQKTNEVKLNQSTYLSVGDTAIYNTEPQIKILLTSIDKDQYQNKKIYNLLINDEQYTLDNLNNKNISYGKYKIECLNSLDNKILLAVTYNSN